MTRHTCRSASRLLLPLLLLPGGPQMNDKRHRMWWPPIYMDHDGSGNRRPWYVVNQGSTKCRNKCLVQVQTKSRRRWGQHWYAVTGCGWFGAIDNVRVDEVLLIKKESLMGREGNSFFSIFMCTTLLMMVIRTAVWITVAVQGLHWRRIK